ncbi:MAG: hypothetical protein WCT39_04145, partial [Candidatus Margulisiibacteriota bacterium]
MQGPKLIEVQRLFERLEAVRKNQDERSFHKLTIQGLDIPREKLTPEQQSNQAYAFDLRYFIEQVFGCGLAYRTTDGALVIRTMQEIKDAINSGILVYQNPWQPIKASQGQVAPTTLPAIAPPVAGQEIVMVEEPVAISTFQRNIVEDVINLIGKRAYDIAALLAFYGKSPQKAWEIVMQVSHAESLELKDAVEMLRLAMDVNSVEGRTIPSHLMVMATLFDNYLPKESARLMAAWVQAGLVSTTELADIFALMEAKGEHGRQVGAVIMLQLAGERKQDLVNRLFEESYSKGIIWYGFEQILGVMHATCRSGIKSIEEYKGKGNVFKSNIFLSQLGAILIDIAKSAGIRSGENAEAIVPYDASLADIFALRDEISVDENMKRTVRRLLDEGEARVAAEIAFGDGPVYEQMYLNMRYCFTPAENGQMLAALDREVLYERVEAFYVGRPANYEKTLEVLEVLLKGFRCFGGAVNQREATALFDEMILKGETQPKVRFAAYWLLQNGVAFFDFKGLEAESDALQTFYIEIVEQLAERHAVDGWRDLAGFMANFGFMAIDPPNQDRTAQVEFYVGIVSKAQRPTNERLFGLRMLWTLRAVESLPDLRKVLAADLKTKHYDEFSMRTARTFFDLCEELDLTRQEHRKLYLPAAKFLKQVRDL